MSRLKQQLIYSLDRCSQTIDLHHAYYSACFINPAPLQYFYPREGMCIYLDMYYDNLQDLIDQLKLAISLLMNQESKKTTDPINKTRMTLDDFLTTEDLYCMSYYEGYQMFITTFVEFLKLLKKQNKDNPKTDYYYRQFIRLYEDSITFMTLSFWIISSLFEQTPNEYIKKTLSYHPKTFGGWT